MRSRDAAMNISSPVSNGSIHLAGLPGHFVTSSKMIGEGNGV
jgi:hypothetical protein